MKNPAAGANARSPSSGGPHRGRRAVLLAMAPTLVAPVLGGCGGSGGGDEAVGSGGGQVPAAAPPGPDAGIAPVPVAADVVLAGLESPWSLCFLPDGDILVTERVGRLRRITLDGRLGVPLAGVPAVAAAGQGGLLDLIAGPDFVRDRTVFFSFAEPRGGDTTGTAVARAVLGAGGLSAVTVVFRQQPAEPGAEHYGSRLAFDGSARLVVTLGERHLGAPALDLTTTLGKTVRIGPGGEIPPDNPAFAIAAPPGAEAADAGDAHPDFAKAGVRPEIWTFGHRNPQGIDRNPWTGSLWISEHGARGGDEINRLRRGRNYGWPRITTSRDYTTGEPLGEGRSAPDVEPPLFQWEPISPAPAGIAFYTGDRLPGWRGSLLVGMLAGQRLTRLALSGDTVTGETRHLEDLGERIRDIGQAPDGYPYFITDSGRLYRLRPQ